MKLIYKLAIVSIYTLLLMSCGGDDGSTPAVPEPVANPEAATLVFPENNTECNEGVVTSATQSTVTFRWNLSANTDSYEVNLRNLNTNTISTVNANTNESPISIARGTPYEWSVISKSNGTNQTATSSFFKFYNQGPGIQSYTPFPAEAISPKRGSTIAATSSLNLEWNGSDVDNDIIDYDVLLGINRTDLILLGTTTESFLEIDVNTNQIYFWKIVSRDSEGNSSQSEIFEFRISN